jgi:hypothetical protein
MAAGDRRRDYFSRNLCRRSAVDNKPFSGHLLVAFFMGAIWLQKKLKGRKGGSSSSRTPTEQPDDLQSVAKAKILVALGEGEFAGQLTGKDIYLDGTALENADGSQNFSGVTWEFRRALRRKNIFRVFPVPKTKSAWEPKFQALQPGRARLPIRSFQQFVCA